MNSAAVSLTEIDGENVDLLPARTLLSAGGRFDLAIDGVPGADGHSVHGHSGHSNHGAPGR